MQNSALLKDFFREIKKTLPRFISIVLIALLGVAFFSGIKSSEPDIRYTGDSYMSRHNLMDIRVMSTLGLDDDDVDAIKNVDGVENAEGGYSADLINRAGGQSRVVHLFSLMSDFNSVDIKEGAMPSGDNECLLDADYAAKYGIHLFDQIEFDSEGQTALKNDKFTVVGLCSSPEYITFSRGQTTKGDGEIDGFAVVLPSAFDMSSYTKVDVKIKGDYLAFTDEYDNAVNAVKDKIDEISQDRCEKRYDKVKSESVQKIDDAQSALDEQKADTYNKLNAAKQEIDSQKKIIEDKKKQIDSFRVSYENSVASYNEGQAVINQISAQIDKSKTELKEAKQQIKEAQETLSGLEASLQKVNEEIQKYEDAHLPIPSELLYERNVLSGQITNLSETISAQQKKINAAQSQIDEISIGLEEKRSELVSAKAQIDSAKVSIDEAEEKIKEGESKLQKGESEYEENKKEADAKFNDAQTQIDKNRQELNANLNYPEWYIQNRGEALPGYDEYGQNADRIKAIGNVFPLIFFLVAVLISLTTVTRMVDEQKTQIGTLKALGCTGLRMSLKYICYAAFATAVGAFAGALIGGKIIPYVILKAYKIMYTNMPDIVMPYNIKYIVLSVAIVFICNVAAAIWACFGSLKKMPADLMRPQTPKSGKRILMERFRVLWKRLSFSQKATFRNLSRYKKRLFMTIFGIAGCMALMVVGFGLRDSISGILSLQFDKIQNYDGAVIINQNADQSSIEDLESAVKTDDRIDKSSIIYSKTVKAENRDKQENNVIITVPENAQDFSQIVNLKERTDKNTLSLNDDGCFITEKLAKLLNVKKGDTITVEEGTKKADVQVEGIVENYLYHYVYMSHSLYQNLFSSAPSFNVIDFKVKSGYNPNEVGKDLMKNKAALNVTYVSTMKKQVEDMLGSLNSVIAVLIISAGLLAFVVLYNLNNININERMRELASIKVLGFTDIETAGYVYRENIYLSAFGIVLGLVFGFFLHKYVISTVEVDNIMFDPTIKLPSYIYSTLLTVVFSIFVNFIMYFKFKKINMVESLKSVE